MSYVCSQCLAKRSRTGFSTKQWGKVAALRRCKDCTTTAGATRTAASAVLSPPTVTPKPGNSTSSTNTTKTKKPPPTIRIIARIASKQHQNLEVEFAPTICLLVTPITRQALMVTYNNIRQSLVVSSSSRSRLLPHTTVDELQVRLLPSNAVIAQGQCTTLLK